jgi:hypothetical protein
LRQVRGGTTPLTEQNLLIKVAAVVCMVSPNKSVSREIDLFRFDEPLAESTDLRLPWLGSLDAPARRRRYHSTQLAIITGTFACGGLICSLLLVDGDEEFPRAHHWLRQSYSSPVIASPGPTTAPSIPQNPPIRSNEEDKSAPRPRWIGARKSASHLERIGRATLSFRPLVALRWHATPFNFSRDLAFGSGSKSSQCRLEEG